MTTQTNPPGAGLSASLRALGATVLTLACVRADLIAVEMREEKVRAERKLLLMGVTALFLAMGLLLAALLVVVLFWDTHRLLAAGGVTLLYLGIGLAALVRLQDLQRNSPEPFSATRSEFAHDLNLLRGRDERDKAE